jgi:tRNA U34 5-methylaminomethyl-2-thiouridine-forming methyltransferase MnmC
MDSHIQVSEDGSPTLVSQRFGVTYHSIYGAIDESITVFLSSGLQYQILRGKKNVAILEMGFGTGLNAFLTLLEGERNPECRFSYTGVELYPIEMDLVEKLSYPSLLESEEYQEDFLTMHNTPPITTIQIKSLTFRKLHQSILDVELSTRFDVIYYDAFAPSAQEELWTPELMQKMYTYTNPGGILVTYCAKGSFKRALKAAGYKVEALPGPPGKREMTRAIKNQ